jgi:hypothetical protein
MVLNQQAQQAHQTGRTQNRAGKSNRAPGLFIAVMLFMTLVWGATTYSKWSRENGASQNAPKLSYQHGLANINAGDKYVPANDITVTRFGYLLRTIATRTGATEDQIANYTVGGWEEVQEKYGRQPTLLTFMEQCNGVAGEARGLNYATVVKLVVLSYED